MRKINKKDSNGKDIFEGDTVQFESNNIYLEDDFISFLKINKVTAYVVPMNNQVGIKLEYRFYSNDVEVYTNANNKEYLLQKDQGNGLLINKWFDSLDVDVNEPTKAILSNKDDLGDFNIEFINKEKTIIKSEATEKEKENYKPDELILCYGDGKTAPINQSFLIKLTKDAIKRVMEVHESIYECTLGYKGEFTHLKLTPDIQHDGEHLFKCEPVDKDMKNNFYSVFDSRNKKQDEKERVLKPLLESISKWKVDNAKMEKGKFDIALENKLKDYNIKVKKIKESVFYDTRLVDSVFVGFAISDNLLDYFLSTGSTITLINQPK